MIETIFYYKRGKYYSPDEIRNILKENNYTPDQLSFIIIDEKYDSTRYIEYNPIYYTGLDRSVGDEIIKKKKEKQLLKYKQSNIPQFLAEQKADINVQLQKIDNDLYELYKNKNKNIQITKSDLLKNVQDNVPNTLDIEILNKINKPIDFIERPNVNKYCILFFNGAKFSFLYNNPVFNENPFEKKNTEFLEEIKKRRENMTESLNRKIIKKN